MVTKEEAKKYLSDVPTPQCFWVNNGPILKNLEELAGVLKELSNESFMHHVNKEKNDFSAWINEVIGDKKLANDLLSAKNRDSASKKVIKRIDSLKKKVT